MHIDDLREIAGKLPGVTEDVKWGNDLCFMIAGKMFAVAGLEPPLEIAFQVTPEEFEELIQTPGIIPAPYMAKHKWIKVNDPMVFSKKQWQQYIKQSYDLKKGKLPKKIRENLK